MKFYLQILEDQSTVINLKSSAQHGLGYAKYNDRYTQRNVVKAQRIRCSFLSIDPQQITTCIYYIRASMGQLHILLVSLTKL